LLGLIYPAVLGNILYLCVQLAAEPQAAPGRNFHGSLQVGFLTTTVIFYFCDYLYITFTNFIRLLFFLFGTGFAILLFLTAQSIQAIEPSASSTPQLCRIAWYYAAFMLAYLIWDLLELRLVRGRERILYYEIVAWEIATLLGLLTWRLRFISHPWALLVIIGASTLWFCRVVYRKWHFYRPGGVPSAPPPEIGSTRIIPSSHD
jgi:hypothetical protein